MARRHSVSSITDDFLWVVYDRNFCLIQSVKIVAMAQDDIYVDDASLKIRYLDMANGSMEERK